jgi:hypothetical protein
MARRFRLNCINDSSKYAEPHMVFVWNHGVENLVDMESKEKFRKRIVLSWAIVALLLEVLWASWLASSDGQSKLNNDKQSHKSEAIRYR